MPAPPLPPTPPNISGGGASRVRIGELLVQSGVLTDERLNEALALHQREKDAGGRRRLGAFLVENGFVEETALTQILGRQLAVPWVSLYHVDFSRQLLNLVPREVAEGYGIIPVYVRHVRGQGDTLYVATDDPTNEEGLKRVGAYAGLPVRPMIASATDIRSAIRVYYGTGVTVPQAGAAVVQRAAAQPSDSSAMPPTERGTGPVAQSPQPAQHPPVAVTHVTIAAAPASPVSPVALPALAPAPTPTSAIPATRPERPPAKKHDSVPPPTRQEGPRRDPGNVTPAKLTVAPDDDGPEIEAIPIPLPARRDKPKRSIALTFLDGTTISLPAPRTKGRPAPVESPPESSPTGEDGLTARDLVAALRAVSHGAEASEILGDNPRWEAMFAALLSLLLKKHLIADWEFVEEFRKI
jgi:type IV pilus assembly protein PilB